MKEDIKDLIRHKLASIDLEDVRDKVKSPDEIKAYEAAIASIFKDHLEPTIKKFIIEQEQFVTRNASIPEGILIGRGTVNGFLLLLEEFEQATASHLSSIKPKESPDGTSMFPEITPKET